MSGISGRSVIVTGGASGIGEAAARLFAENGARVTIADVNAEPGEKLAHELVENGWSAQFVTADVTDEDQVAAMVAAAESRTAASTGVQQRGCTEQRQARRRPDTCRVRPGLRDQRDRAVPVHEDEIPALLRAGGGSIVNTASVGSFIYIPKAAEYTASKHALAGLTKAAAAEYGEHGIRVNADPAPSTAKTRCTSSTWSPTRPTKRPSPRRTRCGGAASRSSRRRRPCGCCRTRRPTSPG